MFTNQCKAKTTEVDGADFHKQKGDTSELD